MPDPADVTSDEDNTNLPWFTPKERIHVLLGTISIGLVAIVTVLLFLGIAPYLWPATFYPLLILWIIRFIIYARWDK